MVLKRWKLPEEHPETIDRLAAELGVSRVLAAVLAARGIRHAGQAAVFLSDDILLEDAFRLADMDKAVARVSQAIDDGERIAVYGDYDCDGVTATVLLTSYLQSAGADVIYYVPDREKEGYGLNRAAVDTLKGLGAGLIVTVDNGVSACDEIAYAKTLGIDVVVTDHHTPQETLPEAVAVVNPHRRDCESSFKHLAGVGVAFKLVCALENADASELLEYYSDLVALGTIADVVPLTGENRAIAKHGIARMRETNNAGINALLDAAGIPAHALSGEAVTFGLVPRINACGRMGCADDAVELLLTDDVRYAMEIAATVNGLNEERKKTEDEIFLECEELLRENPERKTRRVIVITGKNWCHGVVGIVASKVMEKYGRPCILLSTDGVTARGSGRSLEGFSLIGAITACKRHLTMFGGHTLAAGMTLPDASISAFEADLQEYARLNYPAMPAPELLIDCALSANDLTVDNILSLSRLEPFGAANRHPLFLLRNLNVDGVYPTSDKKHIRIKLSSGQTQFYAVYFRMTEQSFPYSAGSAVDIVAEISVQEYNGKSSLSIKIRDLRPANVAQEQIFAENELYSRLLRGERGDLSQLRGLLPERGDFALVYRFLRKHRVYTYGVIPLYYSLMDMGLSVGRLLVCLDAMEELGLIKRVTGADGSVEITVTENPPKVDIETSSILISLKQESGE